MSLGRTATRGHPRRLTPNCDSPKASPDHMGGGVAGMARRAPQVSVPIFTGLVCRAYRNGFACHCGPLRHHSVAHLCRSLRQFAAGPPRPPATGVLRRTVAAKSNTQTPLATHCHHDSLGEAIGQGRAAVDLLQDFFELDVRGRRIFHEGCTMPSRSPRALNAPRQREMPVCGSRCGSATKWCDLRRHMPLRSRSWRTRTVADRHVVDAQDTESRPARRSPRRRHHDLRVLFTISRRCQYSRLLTHRVLLAGSVLVA